MGIPCSEKMKLNKFQSVRVLTTQDIYKRFGSRAKAASSSDDSAVFSRNPTELYDEDFVRFQAARRAQMEEDYKIYLEQTKSSESAKNAQNEDE